MQLALFPHPRSPSFPALLSLLSLSLTPIPCLLSLVEHGQYRPAVELGEKYRDFQLLVQLCEGAGDRERLKGYVKRYAEQVCVY